MASNNRKTDPKPPRSECVRAKCFDCTAQFFDGRVDCEHHHCPLYSRMPYRKRPPRAGWLISGKWSKKHRNKMKLEGLSLLDYVSKYFIKNGKLRFSIPDMMRAKCFDCCAEYTQDGTEKGRVECGITTCPLYRYTPYRQQKPDLNWLFDSDYTNRHSDALIENPTMSREEYIEMKFGRTPNEETDDDDTGTDE